MDIKIGNQILFEVDTLHNPPFSPILVSVTLQESIDKMFEGGKFDLPQYMPSGVRALVNTERLDMAIGQVGLICIRSTYARLGLSAPMTVVDPGFHGELTLSILNTSKHRIYIKPGDQIFSVIRVVTNSKEFEGGYSGRYQNQTGIQIPKAIVPESEEVPDGDTD